MSEERLRSYAVLLLRLALGTMFVAHSMIYMTMTLTLSGTVAFFDSLGLPPWFAYATIIAEALGGLLLILGVQTRWVALALSPLLVGAIWVHSGNGWLFASRDGGLALAGAILRINRWPYEISISAKNPSAASALAFGQ